MLVIQLCHFVFLNFRPRKKRQIRAGIDTNGIIVLVHGTVVAGPIVAMSLSVAKFVASERALAILTDATAEKSLSQLCTCDGAMDLVQEVLPADPDENDPDSITTEDPLLDSVSELEDVEGISTQVDLLAVN